jgi:hypothetical protein
MSVPTPSARAVAKESANGGYSIRRLRMASATAAARSETPSFS